MISSFRSADRDFINSAIGWSPFMMLNCLQGANFFYYFGGPSSGKIGHEKRYSSISILQDPGVNRRVVCVLDRQTLRGAPNQVPLLGIGVGRQILWKG
jgi:hypothetical protein